MKQLETSFDETNIISKRDEADYIKGKLKKNNHKSNSFYLIIICIFLFLIFVLNFSNIKN